MEVAVATETVEAERLEAAKANGLKSAHMFAGWTVEGRRSGWSGKT
jgi:hypothetical protein